ncbi:MAG: DUF4293 domain-containing protein [Rhodothermales bacterium]|nr:DUF4293 domain-containing protein [Rhodothermales bacterium]
MIQRIQSVYLLLASLAFGSEYLFRDIWTGPAATTSSWFLPVTMALFAVAAAGSFVVIFMYANRERQRRFIVILQVFAVLTIIILLYGLWSAGDLPGISGQAVGVTDVLGLVMPFVAYVLLYMARRNVEKDIELVASMDRLR